MNVSVVRINGEVRMCVMTRKKRGRRSGRVQVAISSQDGKRGAEKAFESGSLVYCTQCTVVHCMYRESAAPALTRLGRFYPHT
jgi:hypothetical protein